MKNSTEFKTALNVCKNTRNLHMFIYYQLVDE